MAWIFKHLIVALCAVLAILPVAAIYEEQLGEFDWKRENIGLIDRSFVVSSSLIVVTSKNILASLDSETGSSNWRVLLPTGTQVVEFVEVDGNIVTLTVQQQAGELPVYTVLVRCWSVLDGSLLWDAFMGSYSAAEAAQYEHGEVMYTGSKRILTVLIGNTLHFVSVPSRSFGGIPQYWSWSASSDAPIASAGQTLQLAALVAPTYIEGSSSPLGSAQVESSRLAVGCFSSTSSLSSSGHCDGKLVVVKVQLPTVSGAAVEVSLDEFPGFPSELEVSPGDVAAAISSQASLPYQANDVIFASKGSPLSADLSMVVVSLLDGSLRTLQSSAATADETATSATAAAIGSVRSFVLVSTDGELRPAATVCAGGGEECRTLSLDISSWKLRSEEDSSSSRSPCMAVQLRAHMTYPRIIQSVHCLSFAASETHLRSIAVDGAVADLTSLQVVLPPFRSTPSLPHAHAQRNLLWSAAATAPVYHVQLLSPSKSAQDGCGGRLLVVLHSGVTMLLRTHCTAGSGVPQTQVAWSRNEALASVQQALVIDSASPASASSTTGTGDVNVMPSFLQRLVLQGVKIQVNTSLSISVNCQKFMQSANTFCLCRTTQSAQSQLSRSWQRPQ